MKMRTGIGLLVLLGTGVAGLKQATSNDGTDQGAKTSQQGLNMMAVAAGVPHYRAASLATASEPSPGSVWQNPIDGLKYVWIPPGSFVMGCSPDDTGLCSEDEKPSHGVAISKGFWMGQTEVPVSAYKGFARRSGQDMPRERDQFGRGLNPGWRDEAMPIVNVRWRDAQAFCSWAGGSLPTEAQWEYAARAGSGVGSYGPLEAVAWYADNSGRGRLDSVTIIRNQGTNGFLQSLIENGDGMHKVAQKRPNGFGLFDMLGNVSEWVNDWYDGKYYQNSPSQDPQGPTSGQARVIRGGSWLDPSPFVRASSRRTLNPSDGSADLGFRCVRR